MSQPTPDRELDVRADKCPMPIIKARKEMQTLEVGKVLKVVATDPGSVNDFQGWARTARNLELLHQEEASEEGGRKLYIHYLRRTG